MYLNNILPIELQMCEGLFSIKKMWKYHPMNATRILNGEQGNIGLLIIQWPYRSLIPSHVIATSSYGLMPADKHDSNVYHYLWKGKFLFLTIARFKIPHKTDRLL